MTSSSTTSPATEFETAPFGLPAAQTGTWTAPGDIVKLLSSGASNHQKAAPEDRLAGSDAPHVFFPSKVGDVYQEYPQRPGAIVVVTAPEVKADAPSGTPTWVITVSIILTLILGISGLCCCLCRK